jgi:hypothetical protein
VLAAITVVAFGWTAWRRFGPEPATEPPAVGTLAPRLRLLDPATSRPLVMLGLRGRIVWLAFWSAASPARGSDLAALERAWVKLKGHPRFAMVAAAVDCPPRDTHLAAGGRLPVYLATPETTRAFGAHARHLPLHILIDETGRVGAVAHGMSAETLAHLGEQAETWLDALEPPGNTRLATRSLSSGRGPRAT